MHLFQVAGLLAIRKMRLEVWFLLSICAVTLEICITGILQTSVSDFTLFSTQLLTRIPTLHIRVLTAQKPTDISPEALSTCSLAIDFQRASHPNAALTSLCEESRVRLLSLSSAPSDYGDQTIAVHPRTSEWLQRWRQTMEFFNWTKTAVLHCADEIGLGLRDLGVERFSGTQTLVPDEESAGNIDRILSKEVIRYGLSVLTISTSASTTLSLLSAFTRRKMMRKGYAYLLLDESVWALQETEDSHQYTGLLGLTEADCVMSKTARQCDADRVAGILQSLLPGLLTTDISARDVWELVTHESVHSEVVLVNYQSAGPTIVGRFQGQKLTQTAQFSFPGNSTSLSIGSRGSVEISINSGVENPSVPPTTVAAGYYRGATFAATRINLRAEVLPSHVVEINHFALGAVEWNNAWATARILEGADRLGVAYLAGYASAVTSQTLAAFDKLHLQRPVIGSMNSMATLGNSTRFPWFLRNCASELYYAALYTNALQVVGWTKCAVLYGDDEWGMSVYQLFSNYASSRKLTILNNVHLRKVAGRGTKRQYWSEYREHLLELFRCNARYVVLFLPDPSPQYILELMFDLGARKGDFIFTGQWLSTNYLTTASAVNNVKHMELLEGTIGFATAAWIGAVGEATKAEFTAMYNVSDSNPYACLYSDSTVAVAQAVNTCIELGLDFNDPHQLMKILRETRFIGCSGVVSWLSGENNRAYIEYNILNMVRDPATKSLVLRTVGLYSPASLQVFNMSRDFVFPDGTSVRPGDLRIELTDCPFENKRLMPFSKGRNLAIGGCGGVAAISLLVTTLLGRKAWTTAIREIIKSEMSVEDVLFMAAIGVETIQLAAIGPDFRSLNLLMMSLAQATTVDLSDFISFRNGVYWAALDVTLGAVGMWVLLNLFLYFHLDVRCEKWCLCRLVGTAAEWILPFLGNVCFVPIVFTLLDVFICDQTVGLHSHRFSDSILSRDCFVHCWTGVHVIYAVFSCVSLIIYIPTAILLGPTWQDSHRNLHIKSTPSFLIVKSLVQVTVICISKTAKRWRWKEGDIAFLAIIAVFFALTCRWRAYNYSRVNLWQGLSLLALLSLSVVATIDSSVSVTCPLAAVGGSWAVLVGKRYTVSGVVYQHYRLPSMLYRRPGRDFSVLAKFAFTNRVPAVSIQPSLNYAFHDDSSGGNVLRASDVDIQIEL